MLIIIYRYIIIPNFTTGCWLDTEGQGLGLGGIWGRAYGPAGGKGGKAPPWKLKELFAILWPGEGSGITSCAFGRGLLIAAPCPGKEVL